MKNYFFAIAAIAAVTTISSFSNFDKTKMKLERLSGTYADPKAYSYGKAWGNRVFTFNQGKWTLKFTLALDPEMQMQVFEFRTYGTYKVQEKSARVDNAYEALFIEEKKYVTLKTGDKDLAQAFGFMPCSLTKDVEICCRMPW